MNLYRNYTAQAAIPAYRIVKFGSADGTIVQSSAATDASIGVSEDIPHALGERVDALRAGRCLIELGGTVTRGDWLTSDASGKAVTAAPAAGANVTTIGRAEVSGVAGDIVEHIVQIGSLQG